MTNFQSIGGSIVWVAVAAVLMLATFEPVSVGEKPAQASTQLAETAPAAGTQA